MIMAKWFVVLAGVLGALGVAAGAFGAHGLASRVTAERLAVFETGARYHLLHTLALLACAWLCTQSTSLSPRLAGALFVAGIVIFSGSLYLLVLLDQPKLGAITPIGGVSLIAGWIALAVAGAQIARGANP